MKADENDANGPPLGQPVSVPESKPPAKPVQPMSRPRRWVFRIAALLSPLLLLLLVELGLRLVGLGYPTDFFLKSKIRGQKVYLDNQRFAERFFPPGLARSPQPFAIPRPKLPNTTRLLVFGESAAMGDPEPAFSFGRILEVLLRARFPDRKFEVVNCAVTAINSHVVREIAKDAASLQADYWIVYLGNNEVVGPYGAGTVFSEQTPPLRLIRANLALKTTRAGQWFDSLRQPFTRSPELPAQWEGMEMFLRQQVPQQDPRMEPVYAHFEKNIEDIISFGVKAGAHVLVSTIVCNLRDCPPFGSTNLPTTNLDQWQSLYREAARREEEATNSLTVGAALARLMDVAQVDGTHAELQFRMGRCYARIGDLYEAGRCFEKARDLDTLRFRADGRINRIISQAAVKHDPASVQLVGAVELFERRSPLNVPGEEVFYEHVHLNFRGNYLLAHIFADRIAQHLLAGAPSPTNQPAFLSLEECARRLAYTDWDRSQIVDEVLKRLEQPPFTLQLGQEERLARLQQLRAELQIAARAETFPATIDLYQKALLWSPQDWVLRANFAKLLEAAGDPAGAEREWRLVVEMMPHHAEARYHLANLLDRLGRSIEAIELFRQTLARWPDLPEARNGLALALANQGRFDEAVREYEKTLQSKPEFSEARVNLGQLLAQRGRIDEARQQYQEALRLNPKSTAAHINLGKLLAQAGKADQAISHYQAALRLNPEHAVAHYNLGNAMSPTQPEAALQHYAAAVRAEPHFAEARHRLGLELAKQGRNAEALEQFAESVRLKPTFTEARFNLGVALAKAQRFEEAATHFRETLRLDPTNQRARTFLEQVHARLGK